MFMGYKALIFPKCTQKFNVTIQCHGRIKWLQSLVDNYLSSKLRYTRMRSLDFFSCLQTNPEFEKKKVLCVNTCAFWRKVSLFGLKFDSYGFIIKKILIIFGFFPPKILDHEIPGMCSWRNTRWIDVFLKNFYLFNVTLFNCFFLISVLFVCLYGNYGGLYGR